MEKDLSQLVEKLTAAAGANLKSVVLYGSAVRGEYHPKHSDLNVLAVLERLDVAALDALGAVATWWAGKRNPAPLLFTREEIERSADVFAIEFTDICANRRVLYGEDVFAQLEVPMNLHRQQVERDLRTKLLALRQNYLLASPRGDARLKLMTASVSTFAALFRHVLIALDGEQPKGSRDGVARLATLLGIDPRAFDALLDVREGQRSAKSLDVVATFRDYLGAIEKVMKEVDSRFSAGSQGAGKPAGMEAGK